MARFNFKKILLIELMEFTVQVKLTLRETDGVFISLKFCDQTVLMNFKELITT